MSSIKFYFVSSGNVEVEVRLASDPMIVGLTNLAGPQKRYSFFGEMLC